MRLWTPILCLLLSYNFLQAQAPYRLGSKVADMAVSPVLNRADSSTRFDSLRGHITILDFFGTWCVPCIRALPRLQALQDQNPDSVRVLLVATESPAKLRAFVTKQSVRLPLFVDSTQSFTNRFAPPTYPYTVVLDERGNIIAITEAEFISDVAITAWLAGNRDSAYGNAANAAPAGTPIAPPRRRSSNAVVQLSQDFVYAARTGEAIDDYLARLRALSREALRAALPDDNTKKAFWINLYNGFVQALLRKDPSRYNLRKEFFTSKQLYVAGHALSLDDIQHGILRRSRTRSGGVAYIRIALPDAFETAERVDNVDYRVHFALNCGAKSCPPIAFYSPEDMDKQLDLATTNYLHNEVVSSPSDNIVDVPAVLGWYRNDFGGTKGIRKLLEDQGLIRPGSKPNLRFQTYNWSLELDTKILNN